MSADQKQPEVAHHQQAQAASDAFPANLLQLDPEGTMQLSSERSRIVDFYDNRSIFITGGSGFVGKVLIEKLLRTCPKLRRIYVLIRPKRDKLPSERLAELLKTPLFDQVRALASNSGQSIGDRVIVVEGDVTHANLGLSEQNLLRIMNEVSVIFHSAATVKFDEPLKQSIGINICGTKHIIELCRRIPQLTALVHVSTAYANCDLDEIDEHIYPVNMDPEKLMQMASWLDQDTLQELKVRLLDKRPNTYTYTKALAEWLLIKCARDLPVVICRPSIVTASWREPMPGWIDNLNGPTGIMLGVGKGLIRSLHGKADCVADLVPVDTVINLLVTLGWFAHVYRNLKSVDSSGISSASESLAGSSSQSASEEELDEEDNKISLEYSQLDSQSALSSSPDLAETSGQETSDIHQDIQTNIDSEQRYQIYTQLQHNYPSHHQLSRQIETNNNNDEHNNNNNHDSLGLKHTTRASALVHLLRTPAGQATSQKSLVYPRQQSRSCAPVSPIDDGYRSASRSPDVKSGSPTNASPSVTSDIASSDDYQDQEGFLAGKRSSQQHKVLSFVSAQRRLAKQQQRADFEYKLKEFRHSRQLMLSKKNLPTELADIPVFHCSSGAENPLTWSAVAFLILTMFSTFPSIAVYRVPGGSLTDNRFLYALWRFFLHYLPAYVYDFFALRLGAKLSLVRIYRRFDSALDVMDTFTMNQWHFKPDNRLILINELMSAQDRRLFDCDVRAINWQQYMQDYVIGIREYLLKEPRSNLDQARKNLAWIYYRNLALQVLLALSIASLFFYNFTPGCQLYSSLQNKDMIASSPTHGVDL